ncbi:DUF742 domain-containing protein [Streptomyces sp. NPDC057638]|uniref:DUF742 domain-containing protein n=1 Tax=Streptomyces sp. NPDC057638 TaxID=3346190 RepID=UPI0036A15401
MTESRAGRPLVPAYLATDGETRPSRPTLERLSVLTGLTSYGDPPLPGAPDAPATAGASAQLTVAQRSVLEVLDGGSLTVVETAALLELPVSAVRVLAAQLIDLALVSTRPPIPYAVQPDQELLERVADGLRALKL